MFTDKRFEFLNFGERNTRFILLAAEEVVIVELAVTIHGEQGIFIGYFVFVIWFCFFLLWRLIQISISFGYKLTGSRRHNAHSLMLTSQAFLRQLGTRFNHGENDLVIVEEVCCIVEAAAGLSKSCQGVVVLRPV